MSPDVFEELKWRGMVYDYVEGVQDLLAREKVTIYNGFDATADSLHIGHMVPLIALARLQRYGHHPIALAGGGTTMIGDPSGKATERKLITREEVEANVDSIKKQLAHFLDFDVKANPARVITKADGSKFGKTESGSVWLSAERTSPFRFHQFWLNTDARDVVPYLKYFTFLTQSEIH